MDQRPAPQGVAATLGSSTDARHVRPQRAPSREPLLEWADRHALTAPVEDLLVVLRFRTARVQALDAVLSRLARSSTLLSRWSKRWGVDTFGLDRIAAQLAREPSGTLELASGKRPAAARSDADLRGQLESHYLYAMWIAWEPGEDVRPADGDAPTAAPGRAARHTFAVLRTWLLVRALRNAHKSKCLVDSLLQEACSGLRLASEDYRSPEIRAALDVERSPDSGSKPWDWSALDRMAAPDDWPELNAKFLQTPSSIWPEARYSSQQRWLRTMSAIARGEMRPASIGDSAALFISQRPSPRIPPVGAPPCPIAAEDSPVQPLPFEVEAEDDGEPVYVEAPVEPDASPIEQQRSAQYLQLLTGPAARYIAWDWESPNPPEAEALKEHIDASLVGASSTEALVAAIAWLSIQTGQSLELCSSVRIASAPVREPAQSNGWQLDLRQGLVTRSPTRRIGHWSPSTELASCLTTPADALSLRIHEPVLDVMRRAADEAAGATTIADIWAIRPERGSLGEAFGRWKAHAPAGTLRRLTPGMLGRLKGRQLLDETNDSLQARLLTTSSEAGLPAAAAYYAVLDSDLPAGYGALAGAPGPINVGGSRLDPIDGHLRECFATMRQRIADADSAGDLLRFHNLVTAYWDAVLRAATGIRPSRRRWSSLAAIDEDLEFIYVDEKPSPLHLSGRLIPLPAGLWQQFKREYHEQHLSLLRDRLSTLGWPTDSLQSVTWVLATLSVIDGRLVARSIGESTGLVAAVEHPLPANVFRHWLRTQLHRRAADIEIVDSVLGHHDGATSTHGDYSMRVWLRDANAIRPLISNALGTLDAKLPPHPPSWEHFRLGVKSDAAGTELNQLPGGSADEDASGLPEADSTTSSKSSSTWLSQMKSARWTVKMLRMHLAYADTQAEGADTIGSPVQDKKLPSTYLADITRLLRSSPSEELNVLGRRCMTTEKGTPATLGPLRYGFFLRVLDRTFEREGVRPKLTRRVLVRQRDDSPFDAHAVGAIRRLKRTRKAFLDAVAATDWARWGSEVAAWIAMLDLALSSRCADPELLERLIDWSEDTPPFRVVKLARAHYLEWSLEPTILDLSAPVLRLPISDLCAAALLTQHGGKRRKVRSGQPAPRPLLAAVAHLWPDAAGQPDIEKTKDLLVQLVRQANAIELPGTVGAYLAGRLRCAALRWDDWMAWRGMGRRDLSGFEIVQAPLTDRPEGDRAALSLRQEAQPSVGAADAALRRAPAIEAGKGTDDRRQSKLACRELFARVRAAIYLPPGHARTGPVKVPAIDKVATPERSAAEVSHEQTRSGGAHGTKAFRDVALHLNKLIADCPQRYSSAARLLVAWCASLLLRPVGRASAAPASPDSAARRSLKRSTVLRYFSALSASFEAVGHDRDLLSMDPEELAHFYASVVDFRSRERPGYVVNRLREFHFYCQRNHALPAVDWTDLVVAPVDTLASAGYIDEHTFGAVRRAVQASPNLDEDARQAVEVLLILAFRGGLRANEALGLELRHLRLDTDVPWLIIEKTSLREIKSLAGRRTLPLLGLQESELSRLRAFAELSATATLGSAATRFLFADRSGRAPAMSLDLLHMAANRAIQQVTNQPQLSLHHLRHSLATRVAEALSGVKRPSGRRSSDCLDPARLHEMLRLPWRPGLTSRRAPWAMSRLLGHAHVRTSLHSYVHCLDAHVEMLGFKPVLAPTDQVDPSAAIELDHLPLQRLQPEEAEKTTPAPTFALALEILRNVNSRSGIEQLAGSHSLDVANLLEMAAAFSSAAERMTPRAKGKVSDLRRQRKPINYVATAGFAGRIAASRLPELRQISAPLFEPNHVARLQAAALTPESFESLLGTRNNLNMATKDQFKFVSAVLALVDINASELLVKVPPKLQGGASAHAVAEGWVKADANSRWVPGPRGAQVSVTSALGSTTRGGDPIRQRVGLGVVHGDGGKLKDSLELAFMMSLAALLSWWIRVPPRSEH